jgi:hypothetical protein
VGVAPRTENGMRCHTQYLPEKARPPRRGGLLTLAYLLVNDLGLIVDNIVGNF